MLGECERIALESHASNPDRLKLLGDRFKQPALLFDDLELRTFEPRLIDVATVRHQNLSPPRDDQNRAVAGEAAEISNVDWLADEHGVDALCVEGRAERIEPRHQTSPPSLRTAMSSAAR